MKFSELKTQIILPNKHTIADNSVKSLVRNLAKIKYHELLSISHTLDKKEIIFSPVSYWFPLHHATQNPDARVLDHLCQLCIKYNFDLNTTTLSDSKKFNDKKQSNKGLPANCNAVDIAFSNGHINNFIILYSYGVTGSKLNENGNVFSNYHEEKNYHSLNLPYPNNPITQASYHGRKFSSFLHLFADTQYEEKNQFFKEFIENINYLYKIGKGPSDTYMEVWATYFKQDKIIKKHHYDLSHIFLIPLYQSIKNFNKRQNINFFTDIRPLIIYLEENNTPDNMKNSIKHMNVSKLFSTNNTQALSMINEIEQEWEIIKAQPSFKHINNYNYLNDFLDILKPWFFAQKLEQSLSLHHTDKIMKKNKI